MNSESKHSIPEDWKTVVDAAAIDRCLTRMSYEILERKDSEGSVAIVGIRTAGEYLARRIHGKITEIEGKEVPFGIIDITLYRDDLSHSSEQPMLKATELHFSVSGHRIILVDDVLYTGRTVRAALDAIIDFGRPTCVELAVLADRGHREFPIRPDYVGKNIPTSKDEFVRVRLKEMGYEQDGVYLIQHS